MNTARPPLRTLSSPGLYLTVFMTGSAVMVIELLGTRLIAPFYGASLHVWSSLISVTMIALAAGYFLGGWLADKSSRVGLSLIISLAAVLTLLIPWLTRPVLLATDALGLRAGAFVSALALFSPSLTALGMVSPFAIKQATSALEGLGVKAGSIYAVSTLGSVIGTLLLGFFLFPMIGSREILLGLGWGLLALGLAVAWMERRGRSGRAAAGIPSAVLAIAAVAMTPFIVGAGQAEAGHGKFKLVSERESLYGWVRVLDFVGQDTRTLMSDASTIGAARVSDGANELAYQAIVHLLPGLNPGMKNALLVGQGAGHMATELKHRYGIATDTLEIDPAVADAAQRYFGFEPTGKAVIGDARYEIRHLAGPYDLVIMDCFTGGSEPSHLLTVETLQQLRGLLSEHGLLALNFVAFGDGGRNEGLASVGKTLAAVFPEQSVFVSEPGVDFNDYIFLASDRRIAIADSRLTPDQQAWLTARQFSVDGNRGTLLTDNFNPLEHLQTRKSERYRQVMVEWYGTDMLVR